MMVGEPADREVAGAGCGDGKDSMRSRPVRLAAIAVRCDRA